MSKSKVFIGAALALGVSSSVIAQQQTPAPPQLPQAPNMTFFVTGAGPGKGADLGGIEGADRHCQTLAARHGAGGKTWRAYLSTQAADGKPAVNARDRIGNGPWQNFKGTVVATSVDDLHSANNKLGVETRSPSAACHPRRGLRTEPPRRADRLAAQTAAPSRPARTAPAGTGAAARRARRWSATSTARVCATTTPRSRGIRRTPRAARRAAAARAICAAPAATDCSTASPATSGARKTQ